MASESTAHSAFGQFHGYRLRAHSGSESIAIRARGIIAKYTRVRHIVSTYYLSTTNWKISFLSKTLCKLYSHAVV